MPTYTISSVADTIRTWNSTKGGPMKEYRVALRGGEGMETQNVEWSRKADSPPPEVGQALEGTIDLRYGTSFGPKFTQATSAGRGGGGGGMPEPPEKRRSIAMQHAQKCAVSILEVAAKYGGEDGYVPPNASDVAHQVKTVASILFEQVQQAEEGAAT